MSDATTTAPAAALVTTPAATHGGALSPLMQSIARNYLATRQRAGQAILESARYLAEARAAARYGEWGMFLEATGTQEDTATRMIAIAERASADQQYALAVSDGRLALTAAWEILSAPEATQQRALESSAPTPASAIRAEKRESKLRTRAEFAEPPGWVCEGCGVTITDMKRPMNPICSTCAIRRQALPSADVQHQQTIMAILKETHTPALIQQAYDHAAEIRDIDLHNKMIAVIDRATDPPDPSPRAASATVSAYDQQDRSDKAIIQEAIGMLSAARALLSSVSPGAAWRRDQAHQSITQESARAYLLAQHERLARFSSAGMLSQASFREALDHIAALLEVCQ